MFGQIDMEDALAGTVFMLTAAVTAGIAGGQTYYGYDISASLTTISGTAITAAFVLSVSALGAAYITNRVGDRGMNPQIDTDIKEIAMGAASVETYVVALTLAIVVALGFDIMGFRGFVQSSYLVGTVVVIIEGAGYYVVSYLG
jgi:hypothetical protein